MALEYSDHKLELKSLLALKRFAQGSRSARTKYETIHEKHASQTKSTTFLRWVSKFSTAGESNTGRHSGGKAGEDLPGHGALGREPQTKSVRRVQTAYCGHHGASGPDCGKPCCVLVLGRPVLAVLS